MRSIVTDRVAWSVGLSVCHTSEPCKNGGTDRDAVWVEDSGGPREPCIILESRYSMGRGNFDEGERPAHCKVGHCGHLCQTAEPIVMPFGLCARTGPRNHELEFRWGPDPLPHDKGQFLGKRSPSVKYTFCRELRRNG